MSHARRKADVVSHRRSNPCQALTPFSVGNTAWTVFRSGEDSHRLSTQESTKKLLMEQTPKNPK
jgi:hypothetical protein